MTLLGGGDTAVTLAKRKIQEAIERWQTGWQEATDKERGALAMIVFSHVGSIPGAQLTNYADEKTAKQIKADFEAADK